MRDEAFSLVEILIVLAIVALAMFPIMTLHQGQTFQAAHSGETLRAHSLLLELLIEAEGRLVARRFNGGAFDLGPITREYPWGKSTVEVEQRVSVSPCKNSTGLWSIEASIAWKERQGNEWIDKRRSLSSLLADPSPLSQGGFNQ